MVASLGCGDGGRGHGQLHAGERVFGQDLTPQITAPCREITLNPLQGVQVPQRSTEHNNRRI
jgi:hypothetical protein